MHIGSLGNIIFEVGLGKYKTFKDLTRQGSSRTAKHEIIGQKPKVEFIGPDLEEMSFTMLFREWLGVNITETMEELRQMRDAGEVVSFIIAGELVGENKWLVKEVGETNIKTDASGKIISQEVSISLEEYVIEYVDNTVKNAAEEGAADETV